MAKRRTGSEHDMFGKLKCAGFIRVSLEIFTEIWNCIEGIS